MLQRPARRYFKSARAILRTLADIYDMPGLQVSNIKVKVENGILHISGKKNKQSQSTEVGGGIKAIRIERRRARYTRKFTLPDSSNPEDAKATYRDGVLSVPVAKKKPPEESQEPKTVTIPIP